MLLTPGWSRCRLRNGCLNHERARLRRDIAEAGLKRHNRLVYVGGLTQQSECRLEPSIAARLRRPDDPPVEAGQLTGESLG